MTLPKLPKFPPHTNFVIYDPVEDYSLDHFGSEETLIEFWTKCWKKPKYWESHVKKRCIGLRFDGKKNPKLLQVYYFGFWNGRE